MDAYQLANAYARHTNRCIFLTGKAGTGKTTFLRNLALEGVKQMAVVAPTGVAAINAGGATIHSFFQLPPQMFLPTEATYKALIREMQMRRQRIQLLRNLELLVIDEISMVRADLLDAIDHVLRHYRRRSHEPFGGVQVLFIGDPFQLSPVARQQEWDLLRPYYDGPYFFQSRVFREVNPVYIELNHVFRQDNPTFIQVLNEVRNNCLTPESRALLNARYQPAYKSSEEDYHIILSTHNNKVDAINEEEMDKLPGKVHRFKAMVQGTFPESMYPLDKELLLKEGARVMFVKNDSTQEKRYYNGKLGIVKKISEEGIVVESEGEEIAVTKEMWENQLYEPSTKTETVNVKVVGTFSQVPLRPAWAITIHKSQGLTFNDVVIDAADAFAAGQVYVALSRCRTLEGIILLSKIPDVALNNAREVLQYVNTRPSVSATEEVLPMAQISYLQTILTGIFEFRGAFRSAERLRALAKEAAFSEESEAYLREVQSTTETLLKIGANFQVQLHKIIHAEAQGQSLGPDMTLPVRMKAATDYFTPIMGNLIEQLRQSPCTTDNKETRSDFEEVINQLHADLSRQLFLMQKMVSSPSIKHYQEVRKRFVLPQVFISANPEKQDTDNIENKQLYYQLLKRRKQIAAKADIKEMWQLAPRESMIKICQKLPLTKRDLLLIPKFGPKKYALWGEEILQEVAKYITATPDLYEMYRRLPKTLKGNYLK